MDIDRYVEKPSQHVDHSLHVKLLEVLYLLGMFRSQLPLRADKQTWTHCLILLFIKWVT
jgi:hypothetical protein